MKITTLDIKYDNTNVLAIYIDGFLYAWGEYYYDRMGAWFDGLLAGFRYWVDDFELENLIISDDNPAMVEIINNGYGPPDELDFFF